MNSQEKNQIQYYFETFIKENFGQDFIDALPSKTDIIGFSIEDKTDQDVWFATCDGERLIARREADGPARCHYHLSPKTFREIVAGRLTPQRAFFTLRLKVNGDRLYAIQLGALLEHFFKAFPHDPGS